MRKWTETEAKSTVMSAGDVQTPSSKTIIVKNGLKGLKACSALDYLANFCGYKVIIH
jgi:alkyl hydroperoxide reductase subunit AhpF